MPALNIVSGIEAEFSGTYQFRFIGGKLQEHTQAAGMESESRKILIDTGEKLFWVLSTSEQWTPEFPKDFVLPLDKNAAAHELRGGMRSFKIRFRGIPGERTQRRGGKGTYWGRDVQVTKVLELAES